VYPVYVQPPIVATIQKNLNLNTKLEIMFLCEADSSSKIETGRLQEITLGNMIRSALQWKTSNAGMKDEPRRQ
jgi:hypothetical protein